jgi:hypothetical protein
VRLFRISAAPVVTEAVETAGHNLDYQWGKQESRNSVDPGFVLDGRGCGNKVVAWALSVSVFRPYLLRHCIYCRITMVQQL